MSLVKTKKRNINKIKAKKIDTTITELSKGLPFQFLKFFEIIRNIGFEDTPDYSALRTLLAEMFNDKNYENDFMYDWVIKSKEISKKSKIHSQLLDRTKDDKDDINYAKGRNEDNLFIHKKSFNDESGQIDIHHSSYFKNSTFIKPVKHNYEVTPLNDIYPIMEERLHDTMKHNKKNLIWNKEKGDDINEYKDETKEGNNFKNYQLLKS